MAPPGWKHLRNRHQRRARHMELLHCRIQLSRDLSVHACRQPGTVVTGGGMRRKRLLTRSAVPGKLGQGCVQRVDASTTARSPRNNSYGPCIMPAAHCLCPPWAWVATASRVQGITITWPAVDTSLVRCMACPSNCCPAAAAVQG